MARFTFLSFFFAYLIFLISSLSPTTGAAVSPGSSSQAPEAGVNSTNEALLSTSAENAPYPLTREEASTSSLRTDIRARKARSMKNLIASSVGLLLVPLLAMIVDSGYLLSKVEDLQEEENLTNEQAYERLLGTDKSAAALTAILALLTVGLGVNFAVQAGKLMMNIKKERDLEGSQ